MSYERRFESDRWIESGKTMSLQLEESLEPGEYEVEVYAVDKLGGVSEPVKLVIKVNAPPTVTVFSPENGSYVNNQPTFVLKADDPEGMEVKFMIVIRRKEGEENEGKSEIGQLPSAEADGLPMTEQSRLGFRAG